MKRQMYWNWKKQHWIKPFNNAHFTSYSNCEKHPAQWQIYQNWKKQHWIKNIPVKHWKCTVSTIQLCPPHIIQQWNCDLFYKNNTFTFLSSNFNSHTLTEILSGVACKVKCAHIETVQCLNSFSGWFALKYIELYDDEFISLLWEA